MNRLRIGVGIGSKTIRAVALSEGQLVWSGEGPLADGEGLGNQLGSLLDSAPLPRFPRPVVSVAVGSALSRARVVGGLPPIADGSTMAAILAQTAESFFWLNGRPFLTTGARLIEPGVVLAGAIDRDAALEVRDALRSRRLGLGCLAPAPVAVAHCLGGDGFDWPDEDAIATVRRHDGAILDVRYRRPDGRQPDWPASGADGALGPEGGRFADALGATLVDQSEPVVIRPSHPAFYSARLQKRRLLVPASIGLLALLAFLLSPVAATVAGRNAVRQGRSVPSETWAAVNHARAQLDSVTGMLSELDSFAASRVSMTTLLGGLTSALPSTNAIARFARDHDVVELAIVGADSAGLADRLRAVPGVVGVEPVGLVTTVGLSTGSVERRVFRLHLTASPAAERKGQDQ